MWESLHTNRMRALAQELVGLQPDIIVTMGSTPATVALQRETRTIPIVFVSVADPVASGIVARLDRPSGNITGFAKLCRAADPQADSCVWAMVWGGAGALTRAKASRVRTPSGAIRQWQSLPFSIRLAEVQFDVTVPTVLDRFIRQAVMQILQRQWNPTFSQYSYGFRPRRSAHHAVAQAQQYIAQGYTDKL
jgi:ABC transporter substrate binding protein